MGNKDKVHQLPVYKDSQFKTVCRRPILIATMGKKGTIISKDEILLVRIQNGDIHAFDEIFHQYYPILCAYATNFVDLEEAQGIVQELMIWLWEHKSTLFIESSLKNYLFRSVKNKCLTFISGHETKQQVMASLFNEQSLYEDPDFYIVEELKEKIQIAITHLPDTYRRAFEMNRFQEMTYQEIAIVLNVSSKTVDYRIQQALKLLRKELKDYLPLISIFFNTLNIS